MAAIDIEAGLDDWIRRAWPSGSPPPWPRETFMRFYKDDLERQAKISASSSLGQELTRLRAENADLSRRLKAVEKLIGDMRPGGNSPLGDSIGLALFETTKIIEKRIEPRLQALEKRPTGLQWKGAWSDQIAYPGSSVVIKDGRPWVAMEPTQPGERPGAGGPWNMMVRSDRSEFKKLISNELRTRGGSYMTRDMKWTSAA